MSNLAQELMETSLGKFLSTEEAAYLVQQGEEILLHPGNTLFEAGAEGDALFAIVSGTVEVILGQAGVNASVVATLGRGQIVGELELMTKSLRVATLVATTEATVLKIPGPALDAMLASNLPAATKLVHYIAKTLARRLAAVNSRIVAKTPKTAPPPKAETESTEPMELDDADVVPIDDDDLAVLDELWG